MKTEFHELKLEHLNNCLKHWLLRERIKQDVNQCFFGFYLFTAIASFRVVISLEMLYYIIKPWLTVCVYVFIEHLMKFSKSRFQNYIPSNCTNLLLFISNEHDKVALIQRVAFMYTQNYANYIKQLAAAQIKTFCFWDEKKKVWRKFSFLLA